MAAQSVSPSLAVLDRLTTAINAHDLDAMVACFSPDYHSAFPSHPDRTFDGTDQMLRNWSQIFHAFPDIHVSVVRAAVSGDELWVEWDHKRSNEIDAPSIMRGVTICGFTEDRIAWMRLYLDPVQAGGPGSDAAVHEYVTQSAQGG